MQHQQQQQPNKTTEISTTLLLHVRSILRKRLCGDGTRCCGAVMPE